MCSIETGHASTHAPHVTQSQIISSGTPLPTIGSPSCAKSWSRTPMITSFGERSLPVAWAGQTSWQRPHSVHEKASTTSLRVRSAAVATPKRSSSSGRSKRSGSSRPRARVRASQTLTAAVAMCRCFDRGMYQRKVKMKTRWAQRKTRSALVWGENACAIARDSGPAAG